MSANIPSTMPLDDLLKSTGYNCPAELQGKTFEEATSGGEVSTNTDATIDVSTYTEPVVINPAEGYDATKKVTVNLTNIPSGADIEANHETTIDVSQYTEPVEVTPTPGKDGMAKNTITLTNIPSGGTFTTDMPDWVGDEQPEERTPPSGVEVAFVDNTQRTVWLATGDGIQNVLELAMATAPIEEYNPSMAEPTFASGNSVCFILS